MNKDFKHNLLVSDSKTLEQILALFYQMLKEFPMGIDSQKIVPWISKNLGATFELRAYGCLSIYEFQAVRTLQYLSQGSQHRKHTNLRKRLLTQELIQA